jgi:4-hydroxy-tetrahydrodipicolinate reductase
MRGMSDATTRVCVAGATGWTGRAVCEGVLDADDLELVGAVARQAVGHDLGELLGRAPLGVHVALDLGHAIADADVLVDYTAPDAVKAHALTAIEHGVHVVIGTSGLSAADFADLDAAARDHGVGVVAAGNFSVTAAMAQAAALLVARFLPQREIIDYASAGKPDAPSGTARELAERLGDVATHPLAVPVASTQGHPEARGADIAGTQVHSLRLPSFVVSTEVVFAADGERLSIRHDAGSTPAPYVAGTLLAVRAVRGRVGVVRGLDTLLLEG